MPKTLLVADDSHTMRKVIGMVFATEDMQLTTVDNGIDAISRARELQPDLVLADVVMPGKSGYEVCEALKSDPSTAHIPVLLLAGTFEAFDESRARAAQANDHITKPFESSNLLSKVKALLGIPAGPNDVMAPPRYTPMSSSPPAPQPVAPPPPAPPPPPAFRPPPPAPGGQGLPPRAAPPPEPRCSDRVCRQI